MAECSGRRYETLGSETKDLITRRNDISQSTSIFLQCVSSPNPSSQCDMKRDMIPMHAVDCIIGRDPECFIFVNKHACPLLQRETTFLLKLFSIQTLWKDSLEQNAFAHMMYRNAKDPLRIISQLSLSFLLSGDLFLGALCHFLQSGLFGLSF